jgi:recombination protein RecA
LAPPFKTAEFEIEFGRGISCEAEILDLGCKHDVVTKSGHHYKLNGETFNGKEKAKSYLRENDQIRYELMSKLKEKLLGDIGQEDVLEKDVSDTFSENNDEIIETAAVAEAV